jgi:RsiW-degrading membrane proteinase PrsW (M82 family)
MKKEFYFILLLIFSVFFAAIGLVLFFLEYFHDNTLPPLHDAIIACLIITGIGLLLALIIQIFFLYKN